MIFTITNKSTGRSYNVKGMAFHTLDLVWMSQRHLLSSGVYYTITDENGNSKTFIKGRLENEGKKS